MQELIKKAKKDGVKLVFDRYNDQQPQCKFGIDNVCCRNCFAGPCRIIEGKKGICGANADEIVARNIVRSVAGGASSHADHAREIVLTLLELAEGKTTAYKIKDETKLRTLAEKLGEDFTGSINNIARIVAFKALEDFRRQKGVFMEDEGQHPNWLEISTTEENMKKWTKLGIMPINFDLETSRALHETTMGNDADPTSLIKTALKNGIVDGCALHMTTDLQDVLFGTPTLTKSEANLGVMDKEYVNIAVHGHVPLLSEKIVEWARKLDREAKKVGAKGIKIVGVCCSGNEVLMRHGIPLASHILQAELAIVTGALEAMVVDTQCIYPSLQDVASCYHTKIITTMVARIPGAIHIPFHVENADESAKKIIMEAVNNFKNRKRSVLIPKKKVSLYGGFSVETIIAALRALDKDPTKPLINALKNGDIYGIVALVGCRNPKYNDEYSEKIMKGLIKNNVIILTTGCLAHCAAQSGLMLPDARNFAGDKLRGFLEKIGQANGLDAIPPVLHMGSCVDNSRIEKLINLISENAKISVSNLPIAAAAPELMTEKSIAISFWALSLGISLYTQLPINGSKKVKEILTKDMKKMLGSSIIIPENDSPENIAKAIINTIAEKRKKLGWK